jgi:hypothetical protein
MLSNLLGSPSESTKVSSASSHTPRSAKYLRIQAIKGLPNEGYIKNKSSHNNVLKTMTAINTKKPRASRASLLLFMLRYMTSIVLEVIDSQDSSQRYNKIRSSRQEYSVAISERSKNTKKAKCPKNREPEESRLDRIESVSTSMGERGKGRTVSARTAISI